MKDCTILVNSCDKYEDAWDPFFRILKMQWPECPYDIVLSTETKSYKSDLLNVKTINASPNLSWSSRLKCTLKQIETEYVLFFLEDFFLLEKVQTDVFNLALDLIKSDKSIGLVSFNKKNLGAVFPIEPNYANLFVELKKKNNTRTNVLVGLWRREAFLKLVIDGENPWEYERNSNIRSKYTGFKIYTQNYETSFPAFRYCMNPKDGYGITGGKWLNKNREFFESKGIFDVNYDNLGVFEDSITYDIIQNKNRERQKEKRLEQKKKLKNQNIVLRIKEFIYVFFKKIRKSFLGKKINYMIISVKYFFYYKRYDKRSNNQKI